MARASVVALRSPVREGVIDASNAAPSAKLLA
jgi:hypothetical protein